MEIHFQLYSLPINYIEAKQRLEGASKDFNVGIFEAAESLLSGSGVSSLSDRMDMYFVDFSIMPLFAQENYITNQPYPHNGLKVDEMEMATKAADSISEADLLDSTIRKQMRWDLLNAHGVMSTVAPCFYMQGKMGRINFPSWLGKNSGARKSSRLLQEIQMHMRSATSGSKLQLLLDYLPLLKHTLSQPLIKHGTDGVDDVIEIMDEYDISREDIDSIMQLSQYGTEDIMKPVLPAVKAAFTKKYNSTHNAKVTVSSGSLISSTSQGDEDGEMESEYAQTESQAQSDETEEGEEKEGDDMKADKLIKAKATTSKQTSKTKSKAPKAGTSKGKGTKQTVKKR